MNELEIVPPVDIPIHEQEIDHEQSAFIENDSEENESRQGSAHSKSTNKRPPAEQQKKQEGSTESIEEAGQESNADAVVENNLEQEQADTAILPSQSQQNDVPPESDKQRPTSSHLIGGTIIVDSKEEEPILKESKSQEEYFQMIKEIILSDRSNAPQSYLSNSAKEESMNSVVENFVRQYKQLYSHRKDLFILNSNEFGTKKFVCTTIRPTQLKFKELHDYKECARFVSDYLSYEPLDPPYEIPQKLPSPTFTLKIQSGNCFDYSILLVSLLKGAGYDAYVVSGYATRDVTLMDDSHLFRSIKDEVSKYFLAYVVDDQNIENSAASVNQSTYKLFKSDEKRPETSQGHQKYKLKNPRTLKSQFIQKQEDKNLQEKEVKNREAEKLAELQKENQRLEKENDDLQGLRVHSWVLLLPGKREIAEPLFIEPSTGKVYSSEDKHFLGVESVFNNLNYWVNMQGISFDLGDSNKWEFLLVENSQPGLLRRENPDQGDLQIEEDEESSRIQGNSVDLAPSWVLKLEITDEQFSKRVPSGRKVTIYQNVITETFAAYQRKDGIVLRVIYYTDESKEYKKEIQEYFANRKDHLVKRVRYVNEKEIHEHFRPGRSHALKKQIIVNAKMKEMEFYSSARFDGLFRRIETGKKSMEYFQERDDLLVYRSVTYEESADGKGAAIKMAEKYSRNEDIPASQDIQKIVFLMKEEKIRVVYHLAPGRIIPNTMECRKQNSDQKVNVIDLVTLNEMDTFAPPKKKHQLYSLLLNSLKREQTCLQATKSSEREIQDIIKKRNEEEKETLLYVSSYNTVQNKSIKLQSLSQSKINTDDAEATENASKGSDYLSPFLVNFNMQKLTREDAMTIKDTCLKALKERLIEKANIIQRRLDEESGNLQKAQQLYQKDQDTMSFEETDSYMKFCQEGMFRIQILEKRLGRHKESASEKYLALDKKIRNDPRLNGLLEK